MFYVVDIEDYVRVEPKLFGLDTKTAVEEQLAITYSNYHDEEMGEVIAVINVSNVGEGIIIPGDGATYHRAVFSLLTFYPKLQEVVEGEVVEIADFGAFVRVGPIDTLLHVSQLMDDYMSYDEKQGVLMGKESKRKLATGDQVRVRITAVSLSRGGGSGKVGVTARQPFLGKLEWIQHDLEKMKGGGAEKAKKPAAVAVSAPQTGKK